MTAINTISIADLADRMDITRNVATWTTTPAQAERMLTLLLALQRADPSIHAIADVDDGDWYRMLDEAIRDD